MRKEQQQQQLNDVVRCRPSSDMFVCDKFRVDGNGKVSRQQVHERCLIIIGVDMVIYI